MRTTTPSSASRRTRAPEHADLCWSSGHPGAGLRAGVGARRRRPDRRRRPGRPAPARRTSTLPDATVVPGFVDIHAHGGGGASFDGGRPTRPRRVARAHLAHGTTSMTASLVTDRVDGAGRLGARPRRRGRRRDPHRHPPRRPVAEPEARRRTRPGPARRPEAGAGRRAARGRPGPRPDGHDRARAARRAGRRSGGSTPPASWRRSGTPTRRTTSPSRPWTPAPRSARTCSMRCADCTTASRARSRRCSSTPTRTSS